MVFLLCLGCSGSTGPNENNDNDDNGDNGHSVFTKKTLTLHYTDLKFIQEEHVHFKVTCEPIPESSEILLWTFTRPDSVRRITQPTQFENNLYKQSFDEGDYVLTVAVYDSLDYKELGDSAVDHGSTSLSFSVRVITVEIKANVGQPPPDIYFTAISPERDWLRPKTEYEWDFGEEETVTLTYSDRVSHIYQPGGEYEVIVKILSTLYEDDKKKYTIASDTLTVTVAPELTLTISPQDTTIHAVGYTNFLVECEPEDFSNKVIWKVDYGDGETEEFTYGIYNKSLYHIWATPGRHILDVALHDPATGELLVQDSAVINVDNKLFLHEMNYLYVYVKGYTVRYYGSLDKDGAFTETSDWPALWGFGSSTWDTKWDGFDFSAKWASTLETQSSTVTFSGTVAEDLSEVVRVEWRNDFIDTDTRGSGSVWTRMNRFVLEHVPIEHKSASYYNSMRFYEKDTSAGQYMTEFEGWETMRNPDSETSSYIFYGPFDWQNTELGTPEMTVEFKKQ